MIDREDSNLKRIVASCPGGNMSRQSRVQYQAAPTDDWQMYASFDRSQSAQECAKSLQQRGLRARVVDYRICPSAS